MVIVGSQHFTTYPVFPGTTRMLTAVCSKCFRIFGSPYRNNLLLAEHAHLGCCNGKQPAPLKPSEG